MAHAAATLVSSDARAEGIDPARAFLLLFPLSAILLFVALPSAQLAFAASLVLSSLMVVSAGNGAFQGASLEEGQGFVAACAPVHFALVLWVCVAIARSVSDFAGLSGGVQFAGVFVLSFAALAVFLTVEFVASLGFALLLERGRGSAGAGFAALVSARYAGALGRVV